MSKPLPSAWVDRLFSRLAAFYGSQKLATMWVDADMAEVKAVWAEQLGRFEPASISAALQRLIDSGNQWPPTLPEFVELCRQAAVGRQQEQQFDALPAPGQSKTDVETAKQRVAELMRSLAAAKRMPT
ncbi:MAG TPA: hypothetical protein PKC22_08770 [Rhodocyclaceae bacterium]|nr:hypothetical protein [Rhodocyclaceae bacterium]